MLKEVRCRINRILEKGRNAGKKNSRQPEGENFRKRGNFLPFLFGIRGTIVSFDEICRRGKQNPLFGRCNLYTEKIAERIQNRYFQGGNELWELQ